MLVACSMPIETPPDHAALVRAVAEQQDRAAFAALFRHFGPRLRGWFRNGGVAGVADELVQETLLRVWRSAHRYDPGKASVTTWVFTIARNVRIDHLRKRRPEVSEDDPCLIESDAPRADALVHALRQARNVREALETLPEDQAVVVRKAYLEHQTLRDISEELDVPLGTVKSRVRLALGKLRDTLEGSS